MSKNEKINVFSSTSTEVFPPKPTEVQAPLKKVKEIHINELIARLSAVYKYNELSLATESDYNCYEMCTRNYEKDKQNKAFPIGYHYQRPRNGTQFATVCVVEQGKIVSIDLKISPDTINLAQLYIDNVKGKNIIITDVSYNDMFTLEEMPYESE